MAIDSHVVSRHLHTWTSLTSWKEPFSWMAQTHILMIILVSFIKYPQKTEDGWKMFDLWQWLEKLIHIIYNICLKFTVLFDINHRIWKRTNSAMWDCYCWCTSTHFFYLLHLMFYDKSTFCHLRIIKRWHAPDLNMDFYFSPMLAQLE